MTEYFDNLRRQVADLVATTSTDQVLIERVKRLEDEVIRTVSLCTGDREFPGRYREAIQGLITVHRLEPAGGPADSDGAKHYLIMAKDHRLFDELHSAFHKLASERIRTRFGLLSDSPADIVRRRDDHDSCDYEDDEDNIRPPEPDTEVGNPVLTVIEVGDDD